MHEAFGMNHTGCDTMLDVQCCSGCIPKFHDAQSHNAAQIACTSAKHSIALLSRRAQATGRSGFALLQDCKAFKDATHFLCSRFTSVWGRGSTAGEGGEPFLNHHIQNPTLTCASGAVRYCMHQRCKRCCDGSSLHKSHWESSDLLTTYGTAS